MKDASPGAGLRGHLDLGVDHAPFLGGPRGVGVAEPGKEGGAGGEGERACATPEGVVH